MQSGFKTILIAFCASLVATGCGNLSLWPFGDSKATPVARGYENATEFRCEGGKVFHVRYLDGGKSAWVILPDRQVRLDRAADSGSGYTNGIAVLQVSGTEATLTDGPAISFSGCKAATAAGRP